MRLKVVSTCFRKSSQSWSGQSLSTVVSVEMKCFLNVAIAHLVALTWWLWGRDQVDVHALGPGDVGFDSLGTLIVHDIERWCVSICI